MKKSKVEELSILPVCHFNSSLRNHYGSAKIFLFQYRCTGTNCNLKVFWALDRIQTVWG